MKTIIHKGIDRGTADHGWLQANFSFSFAHYYDHDKVNFGALRVLNDDIIGAGMGFGTHPHDNMEIISIPLKGSLKHRDSMSNEWIPLHTGEVQIMSAGKGIQHSEMNNSVSEEVNLFQIWIFPDKQDVEPRYDQKEFSSKERANKLQVLVSSIDDVHLGSLKIHQDAKISRIDLSENSKFKYSLKSKNHGVFIMIINGQVEVETVKLESRDALALSEISSFEINTLDNSELLFIEVPMQY
jgi:redox-sensitive bicupin YhaK (pirin superfamily)